MSIIETMARAVKADIGAQMGAKPIHPDPKVDDWAATSSGAINLEQVARAALRAIKPSDISDGMVEAYLRAHGGSDESVKKALFMGVNDFRRAIAAAIAAGGEQ